MVTIKSAASNESPENRSMSIKAFDIERMSFKIIDDYIRDHDYELQYEWPVVRRVIHATADFEFATKEKIIFNHTPITSAFKAFQNGSHIITDVEMVRAGISKINLKKLNLESVCKISDQNLIEEAKKLNKTRAEMAMLCCREEMDGGVVVIGNAPTALYETIRMIKENLTKPSVVIGIPVGFVSALESKMELLKTNIPSITNLGRKGGSSVASSIINALLLLYLQMK